MRRILALALVGMSIAASGLAQTPAAATEQELIKVEHAWSDAVVKHDGAALQRLYADEYFYTDSDGVVRNKTQDISDITSGKVKIASYVLDDLKVHVYGETAVVTGRNTLKGTFEGKDISGAYRFTDVFVKRAGRWQAVATQSTLAKK